MRRPNRATHGRVTAEATCRVWLEDSQVSVIVQNVDVDRCTAREVAVYILPRRRTERYQKPCSNHTERDLTKRAGPFYPSSQGSGTGSNPVGAGIPFCIGNDSIASVVGRACREEAGCQRLRSR